MHDADAPIFVVMGDGTFGFHLAEIETAVRRILPFIAIVGNDAPWNAESQLQRWHDGENRMHGCELLAAHYDAWASAPGGHGEFVTKAHELDGAIARAIASGRPAVINNMTDSIAAPGSGARGMRPVPKTVVDLFAPNFSTPAIPGL